PLHPPPARGSATERRSTAVRGPAVARQHERGLSDRASPRAGPDRAPRARGHGLGGVDVRCRRGLAAPAPGLRELGGALGDLGAVLARLLDDDLALLRRHALPEVVGSESDAEGAGASGEFWHG